jgi:hypothetical protein
MKAAILLPLLSITVTVVGYPTFNSQNVLGSIAEYSSNGLFRGIVAALDQIVHGAEKILDEVEDSIGQRVKDAIQFVEQDGIFCEAERQDVYTYTFAHSFYR